VGPSLVSTLPTPGIPSPQEVACSTGDPGHGSPEEEAAWYSRLVYGWLSPLVALGARRPLERSDLPAVARRDSAHVVSSSLGAALRASGGRLGGALWACHRGPFLVAGAFMLARVALSLAGPLLLEQLLLSVEGGSDPLWRNGALVASMWVAEQLRILANNLYFERCLRISMHVRAGLLSALFSKLLRASGAGAAGEAASDPTNLQATDARRVQETAVLLHQAWSAPLQVAATIGLAMRLLTPVPALVGLGATLVFVPVNLWVGRRLFATRRRLVGETDRRVRATAELLTGIKAVKLNAWEGPHAARIDRLRQAELASVRRTQYLNLANVVVFLGIPVFIAVVAFATYVGLGNELQASVAFPALSLFALIQLPVLLFPILIAQLISARVSARRLRGFLAGEEVPARPPAGRAAVAVRDGARFAWPSPPRPGPAPARAPGAPPAPQAPGSFSLGPLSLAVPEGSLVMVVGEVGSGKTSLLLALLREMPAAPGAPPGPAAPPAAIRGSVAYTAQDPWVPHATLRDAILMGRPHEPAAYDRAVACACLAEDLSRLPLGDRTEIGERGVNLSGGQKHRVALARAVYADADVYLLDDPLSAVDAHVGRQLFEGCIAGALRGKTRVLVTHQLQYLARADTVVVLDGGRVAHAGPFASLREAGVEFSRYAGAGADAEGAGADAEGAGADAEGPAPGPPRRDPPPLAESASTVSDGGLDGGDAAECAEALAGRVSPGQAGGAGPSREKGRRSAVDPPGGRLVAEEARAVGSVGWRVYAEYLGSWGPAALPAAALALACVDRGLQAGQQFWVSEWADRTTEALATGGSVSAWFYMGVYAALGLGSVAVTAVRSAVVVLGSNNASRRLHAGLLSRVVRLPMSFFDAQPLGRLLNRFTSDLDAIDASLSLTVATTLTQVLSALASMALLLVVTPWIGVALAVAGVVYARLQRVFVSSSRELKRLDAVSLSPILSLFSETLGGRVTVRAFAGEGPLQARNEALVDRSTRAYWPYQIANRWLSVRLETTGNAVTALSALLVSVVLTKEAGLVGLVVSSASQVTLVLSFLVRQLSELEVAMNAVERVIEYRSEPEEAPAVVPDRRPPPSWPARGGIRISDLDVRYRPGLDLVLRGISVDIRPGEKVGLVGRTGSGKSSLVLALYRIVEPAGGTVVIDGVDVSQIGLFDLRSRLSLVPQDPVLFSGTVRSNLDPFGAVAGDDAVWQALGQVHLSGAVRALGGLDAAVAERGGNLSLGQRQLLCVARALLRNSRILLLDEATSSVDAGTDEVVQEALRAGFGGSTVLTIAHRLDTVIESDRVLVLDRGRLREDGAPGELVGRRGSLFAGLVDSHSRGGAAALRKRARGAASALF